MLYKEKQSSCLPTSHLKIEKHVGQETLEYGRAEEDNGKSIEFGISTLCNMRLT